MSTQSHKSLAVWQKSMDVVATVYTISKLFLREELYGLTSQVRRAAVSVPSNIAEGRARYSTKEFMRFLLIARGSIAELETQLLISLKLSYVSAEQMDPVLKDVNEIGRMLSGLLSKLEQPFQSKTANN